jgi:DNA-directed RNA polymerase specialized sigma24 family protein
MAHIGSVTQLLQQFHAGDDDALAKLVQRHWPFLLARAGERLPRGCRRAADEEDVALEVVLALHAGREGGQWQRLANRRDLVALLTVITERRAINQLKREMRRKRGGGAPEPLLSDGADSSVPGAVAADRALPAPDAVVLDDWCRHCLANLGAELRPVAELLLAGHSRKEIAATLRCSERTVTRKVSLIQARWLELMAEVEEGLPAS